MALKFVQTQAIALLSGISGASTSCVVTPYPRDIQTNAKLVFADFGTTPTFTVDPKIPQLEEICSFTGMIDNGDDTATLTGLTRNLIGQSPYTTSGTGKLHGSSAVIVFSDNPQLYARLAGKENDETIPGLWDFTNGARTTKKVQSVTNAATITPNADTNDCVDITAIAQTFTIANPTGTARNFQPLIITIKDNGTGRAITFGTAYVAGGYALPTTTIANKILTLGFVYTTANSLNKWRLVGGAQEI